MRHTVWLVTLALAGVAAAGIASAEEKKPLHIRGWGDVTDPAGDCKIAEAGGRLTFTVPGTQHNLNPLPEYDNVLAPRVLQGVGGDFRARVKVSAFPLPAANTSTTRQGHSYAAAGLLVWHDEKTFVRCLRAGLGERGETFVHVEGFKDGKYPDRGYRALKDRRIPDKDVFLQVERRGTELMFSRSMDGKEWEAVVRLTGFDLPDKVRVGVAAVNSTKKVLSVGLEGLTVRAPE